MSPGDTDLFLAADVHLATLGDDAVFLSVTDDAYSLVAGAASHLRRLQSGRVRVGDAALAAELQDLGLLSQANADSGPEHWVAEPRRDLRDAPRAVATTADRSDFGRTAMAMLLRFHGRSLSQLLQTAQGGGRLTRHDPDVAQRRAALFMRWLPWVPGQGVCLYRSYFLLRFLQRAGVQATWVFGVRTWPFSAHCWLQAGELVLDDDLDRVRAYTPILVA